SSALASRSKAACDLEQCFHPMAQAYQRQAPTTSQLCHASLALAEAAQCSLLVGMDLKKGMQLRDLEKILHALGEVDKLQLAAAHPDGCVAARQLADAKAVNEVHLAQVQQEFLLALARQHVHEIAERCASGTQRETTASVNDGHVT